MEITSEMRSDHWEQANLHACKLLLNCYIRELAQEKGSQIRFDVVSRTFAVDFPASGVSVSGRLAYYSAMGEHEYENIAWASVPGIVPHGRHELHRMPCESAVDYIELVQWIIRDLSVGEEISPTEADDFAAKVDNSFRNLAIYMKEAAGYEVTDYRTSEQGLVCGHPFHPFPKNTLGFTEQDVQNYSPELQTSFRLGYFAVRKDVYHEEWVFENRKVAMHEQVRKHLKRTLGETGEEYELLPVHPWQYEHVLGLDAVQEYVLLRKIIPLGCLGPLAYPTSSVRTVYVPELNCNIKLSLNMQITNLIRNNNAEQMRRTLDASRYLQQQGCFEPDSQASIAYESGISTCCFPSEDLTRLFTAAYRPIEFDPSCTYVIASLVEAPLPGQTSRLFRIIEGARRSAALSGLADASAIRWAERWFWRYLELSLLPIVDAAWEKGIHFEAHLQNTLLTLRDGLPEVFIIRDLEGVSIEEGRVPDGAGNPDDLLESPLFYPREQAWARTSYYFIVNHLGSFIHALARDLHVREEHFWDIVREMLLREMEHSGNEYIRHLLNADGFQAKQNLLSCLRGHSETPGYVTVPNMMKRTEGETSGNDRLCIQDSGR